jgi:formylglycine-generating enzyme required for sulfatase activity
MMTKTTLTCLFLFFCALCRAQSLSLNKKATPAFSTTQQQTLPEKNDSAGMIPSIKVLFATNEDCQLYINEEPKGHVSKDSFLYLPLPSGTYRYLARAKNSGDEWRDTFSVTAARPTEVFIDMLYAIDAGNEKRASVRSQAFTPTARHRKSKAAAENIATKKGIGKEQEAAIINSFFANLVPVKGGSFIMGNNHSSSADEEEHPVQLNTFWFSKYEITQEQWESIMGYNPSVNQGCATCPVENVSWEEVMTFIRKLNAISNKKFRLPTEAEWEYVAKMGGKAELEKAGSTEEYIRKTAWAFINAENRTHPVGGKQPNAAGIYDVTGNVSEWCMDWYGAFFYKEDFTDKNPEGPPLGKEKIIRGGNYKDYVGDRFRPSFRNKMNPKNKTGEVGFRLAMDWDE